MGAWSAATLRTKHGRWMSGAADRQGKRLWTPWEMKTLVEMRAAGKGSAEIAAALPGRSATSVRGKIRDMDQTPTRRER